MLVLGRFEESGDEVHVDLDNQIFVSWMFLADLVVNEQMKFWVEVSSAGSLILVLVQDEENVVHFGEIEGSVIFKVNIDSIIVVDFTLFFSWDFCYFTCSFFDLLLTTNEWSHIIGQSF